MRTKKIVAILLKFDWKGCDQWGPQQRQRMPGQDGCRDRDKWSRLESQPWLVRQNKLGWLDVPVRNSTCAGLQFGRTLVQVVRHMEGAENGGRRVSEGTMIEFLEPIPSQCPGHPGHVKVISVIPDALDALADSVKQGRVWAVIISVKIYNSLNILHRYEFQLQYILFMHCAKVCAVHSA